MKWAEVARDVAVKAARQPKAVFGSGSAGKKPQWRNKVKKVFDETGYELDGKFLTSEKANRLGMENPDLVTKFRKAVRREGKIEIIRS